MVSGAAFGIDAAAHRGALSVDGATVAVLAGESTGPTRWPHAAPADRRGRGGGGRGRSGDGPDQTAVLLRNRIIASISRGVVVVEAALGPARSARRGPPPTSAVRSASSPAGDLDDVVRLPPGPARRLGGDRHGRRRGDRPRRRPSVDAAPRRSAEPDLTDLLDPDSLVLAAVPIRLLVPRSISRWRPASPSALRPRRWGDWSSRASSAATVRNGARL